MPLAHPLENGGLSRLKSSSTRGKAALPHGGLGASACSTDYNLSRTQRDSVSGILNLSLAVPLLNTGIVLINLKPDSWPLSLEDLVAQ